MFGSERLASGDLAVSSSKGACGHLLGAAGAVEAAATALSVHQRIAPGTANLHQPDEPGMRGLLQHAQTAELARGAWVMCNSFGFGGVNMSVVLGAPPA